jgi:CHAD domain-containing protein
MLVRESSNPQPSAYAPPGFKLGRNESLGPALVRSLLLEIEAAQTALGDPNLPRLRAVHAARRHVKRARTAVRLLRPVIPSDRSSEINRTLRDAARSLAGDRDKDIVAALARRLAQEAHGNARLLLARVADRSVRVPRHGDAGVAEAVRLLSEATGLVRSINLRDDPTRALSKQVARLYARGHKAMRQAAKKNSNEEIHEWRKRVKDRWHAARLFKAVWPKGDKPRTRALDELGDMLGADHDLTVLGQAVEREAKDAPAAQSAAVLELIRRRQKALRRNAQARGRALYRKRPKQFAKVWARWASARRAR